MLPSGVHHLALQVRDLEGMTDFYTGVLGLPVLRRWTRADGPGERSVWLDLGRGAFLALEVCTGAPAGAPFFDPRPGLHLVALGIAPAEREPWRARLAAAGVPVVHETDFTLYFHDPEGNRVALSHHPERATGA